MPQIRPKYTEEQRKILRQRWKDLKTLIREGKLTNKDFEKLWAKTLEEVKNMGKKKEATRKDVIKDRIEVEEELGIERGVKKKKKKEEDLTEDEKEHILSQVFTSLEERFGYIPKKKKSPIEIA